MAEVLILEFSAVGAVDLYRKVSGHTGLVPSTGAGDWPVDDDRYPYRAI